MKIINIAAIFVYSFNANELFGREINLTDSQFWVPIAMMMLGFTEGYLSKK